MTSKVHDLDEQHQNGTYRAFQEAVSEYLIRHKSILDVSSKMQESGARVNRAFVKAITTCGCIEVAAGKQKLPSDITYWEMRNHMATHLKGSICENCSEILELELGRHLFYLAALCDLFDLSFDSVIDGERRRVSALGVFNLT